MEKLITGLLAGVVLGTLLAWSTLLQAERTMNRRIAKLKAEETVWALDTADRMLCEKHLGIIYGEKVR